MKPWFVLGAVLIAAVATPGNAAEPFSRLAVEGTSGRVGYHMSTDWVVYKSDTPDGCAWFVHSWSHSGPLPPGIEFVDSSNEGGPFRGTPRQPGKWNLVLDVTAGCGPQEPHYRKKIYVTLNIEP